MSFRRSKSQAHRNRREWDDWLSQHRQTLQSCGLAPEVYLSAEHWDDFLQNGYLEWHRDDTAGFAFDQLSPTEAGALRRFLEEQCNDDNTCPPLLQWLRERHAQGMIA